MRGFYRHRGRFAGSQHLKQSIHQSIRVGGGDFSRSRLYLGRCVVLSRRRDRDERGWGRWSYNLYLYLAKLRIQIGGR